MKLKGQVAVVTGAGRNIGKAMAKLFASEGAKIAVVEMHEGRGQAVVDEINQSGHEAMLVRCDVAKASDDVTAARVADDVNVSKTERLQQAGRMFHRRRHGVVGVALGIIRVSLTELVHGNDAVTLGERSEIELPIESAFARIRGAEVAAVNQQ